MLNTRATYLQIQTLRVRNDLNESHDLFTMHVADIDSKTTNTSIIPLKSELIILLLLFTLLLSLHGNAQNWEHKKERLILKNWALNFSGGTTSYYGDLSTHDNMFFGKLQYESGPAYSFSVIKEFGRSASIEGQLIKGNFVCKNDNVSIKTNIFEYNLLGKINLVELLSTQRVYRKFGLIAFAGIGNFLFTTEMKEVYNEIITITSHKSRVPEFVYFVGGGISYDLSARLSVTSDLSIRQCQNDKLDIIPKNGDFDYYSYLNIGITYRIHNLAGKFDPRGEKLVGWEKMKPIYRPQVDY